MSTQTTLKKAILRLIRISKINVMLMYVLLYVVLYV